jgi:tight adherence protein B
MKKLILIGGIVSALAVASPAAGADGLSLSLAPDAKFPQRELVLTLPPNTNPADVVVTENGVPVDPRIRAVTQDSRPLSVAVLIDSSNSMRGEALTSAVNAARTLIAGKPARSEAAVFTFARTPELVVPWSTQTGDPGDALTNVTPSPKTALWDAVVTAGQQLATRDSTTRAIVLLTDGRDNASVADLQSALKVVTAAHVRVFAIGLAGANLDRNDLQTIVDRTGGEFIEVQSADQLKSVYAGLARRLSHQYLLTYTSQQRTAGKTVVVRARLGTAVAEQRYTVPQSAAVASSSGSHEDAGLLSSNLAVAGLAAAVGAAVLLGAFLALRPLGVAPAKRLRRYGPGAPPTPTAATEITPVRPTKPQGGRWTPRGIWTRFNADVERGGIDERPGRLILGATAASVLAAIVVAVVTQRPVTALVVAPLGPIVAWVYVTRRASSWYAHFDATLADSLTVLAASLRAGHSLLQAIAHVAEEADDRIAAEWQETVRRTRLGVAVEDALDEMVVRVGNRDLQWIALVARVQHQAGGNMAEMFDIVAETVRQRHRLRDQIQALTAQGRMSRWVLTIMPFAMAAMFFVLSPTYLQQLYSPLGALLVGIAFVSVIIGSFWLKQITEIEV